MSSFFVSMWAFSLFTKFLLPFPKSLKIWVLMGPSITDGPATYLLDDDLALSVTCFVSAGFAEGSLW